MTNVTNVTEIDKNLYNFTATLSRIIDGDTIEVIIDLGFNITYKEKVRISKIDTPEINVSNTTHRESGILVKNYLKSLLENKKLYLKTYKSYEKYDRYNAMVQIEHPDHPNELLDVSTHLLTYKLAHPYEGGKKQTWTQDELLYIKNFFALGDNKAQ